MSKTVLFQTIQFSISTQFISIWPRCYHSGPVWTWERWQWRSARHSPKVQHYWNLTTRLFSVIYRTLASGVCCSSAETQSVNSTAPADWASSVLFVLLNPILVFLSLPSFANIFWTISFSNVIRHKCGSLFGIFSFRWVPALFIFLAVSIVVAFETIQ